MWLYDSLLHKKYLLIKYYFYSYCNNHLTLFTIFDLLLQLKMLHSKLLHTILLLLLLQNSLASEPNTYWSWCANELQLHGKSAELYNRRRGACQSELTIWHYGLKTRVSTTKSALEQKILESKISFQFHGKLLTDLELEIWKFAMDLKILALLVYVCCHMEEFQEVWLGT